MGIKISVYGMIRNQGGEICEIVYREMGFPCRSVVKNLPANAGDVGLISGSGRSRGEGNGNPHQYSHLGNPMNRRNLVGYSPWGRRRAKHDLVTRQKQ